MSKQLHIIEPTLFDQTGHGYSYVHSLLQANVGQGLTINVWMDRRGKNLLGNNCVPHLYFWRKLRQLQKIALYFKLCLTQDIIFVSTSDLWDLKVLHFWSKLVNSRAKIYLHFHQFKQTSKKLQVLRKLATSTLNILTPTAKLTNIFVQAGFNCHTIPCPTFYPERKTMVQTPTFSKLLYAGAARSDKGFPMVVQLLQHLRSQQNLVPFAIQVSAPNSNRYDESTQAALQTLHSLNVPNLTLYAQTLDQAQYLELFNNAICLLLYDQTGYSDKFSGIALDAFYAGCPVVTVSNTWMGDTATHYKAGIAVDKYDLSTIQDAIATIMQDYAFYQSNAQKAAIELQQLHDPLNTLQCLCK